MNDELKEDRNWHFMIQTVALWRALQVGPADRDGLMARIRQVLPSAFQQESEDARRRSFERSLRTLRDRLEATVDWDPEQRVYSLEATGPYLAAPLSDAQLIAVGVLLETFGQDDERLDFVGPILEFLQKELSSEHQRLLARRQVPLQIDVRRKDEAEIAPVVWRRVRRAVEDRHVLRFNYNSPIHEDDVPRTHTVEPYRLDFHSGHYYLKAYQRRWTHPDGYSGGDRWTDYRIDHILPQGIEILPEVLPLAQRSQRLIPIRYRIAPRLARGNVTYHFEEMCFSAPEDDGWVTVTARVENLFDTHRVLLSFGELCVAEEPAELVRLMQSAAHGMASHYEPPAGDTGA